MSDLAQLAAITTTVNYIYDLTTSVNFSIAELSHTIADVSRDIAELSDEMEKIEGMVNEIRDTQRVIVPFATVMAPFPTTGGKVGRGYLFKHQPSIPTTKITFKVFRQPSTYGTVEIQDQRTCIAFTNVSSSLKYIRAGDFLYLEYNL